MNDFMYVDPQIARKQQEQLIKQKSCMIFPNNKYKQWWDLFIVLLLIYTALLVPFNVCFFDVSSTFQLMWDILVDLLFVIDIILAFFCAHEDRGVMVVSRT